jgi:hypothetical protein
MAFKFIVQQCSFADNLTKCLPEIIQFVKKYNLRQIQKQIRNKYNAAGQKLSSRNITVEAASTTIS